MNNDPHICVDLDGTLAEYDSRRPMTEIGPAIPAMLRRVKIWLDMGIEVRIMTARACYAPYIPGVEKWLEDNGIPGLKVTNEKTFGMLQLWDDRAIQVIENTGIPVTLATNAVVAPEDVYIEPEPLKSAKDQIDT